MRRAAVVLEEATTLLAKVWGGQISATAYRPPPPPGPAAAPKGGEKMDIRRNVPSSSQPTAFLGHGTNSTGSVAMLHHSPTFSKKNATASPVHNIFHYGDHPGEGKGLYGVRSGTRQLHFHASHADMNALSAASGISIKRKGGTPLAAVRQHPVLASVFGKSRAALLLAKAVTHRVTRMRLLSGGNRPIGQYRMHMATSVGGKTYHTANEVEMTHPHAAEIARQHQARLSVSRSAMAAMGKARGGVPKEQGALDFDVAPSSKPKPLMPSPEKLNWEQDGPKKLNQYRATASHGKYRVLENPHRKGEWQAFHNRPGDFGVVGLHFGSKKEALAATETHHRAMLRD